MSDLTHSSKTPFVFFCTTTNVQDKKFVSLKDYVNVRKITAKKVLNKNYIISVFHDKTAYIGTRLQDRVPVVKTVHVSVTFT